MDRERSRGAGLSAEEMERVMKGTVDRLFNKFKIRTVSLQEIEENLNFCFIWKGCVLKPKQIT